MAEKKSIFISGAAFSFLMYEIARINTGQEGFLLGECIQNEISTITDNDQPSITIERIIKINAVIPCPKLCYFYNGAGNVDKTKLKIFLKDHISNVVGWYRFRHMVDNKLTLRDKLIHKQLMRFFSPPKELFACGLLTINNSNPSTHIFKQTFLQYNNLEFAPVNIRILNLNNTNYNYKTSQMPSKTFNKIMKSLEGKATELHTAEAIFDAVQTHINNLTEELAEEEIKMFNLEQEVKQLQEQLNLQKNLVIIGTDNNLNMNGDLEDVSLNNFISNSSCILEEELSSNITEKVVSIDHQPKSYSDMLRKKKE